MDLEGIVAKHSFGVYVTEQERTSWFKIKNRSYSQWQVVKNYSSENVTRNLLLAGIAVDWLVRGWNMHCEIEYVTSGSDNGTLCGKPAVAKWRRLRISNLFRLSDGVLQRYILRSLLRLSRHALLRAEARSDRASPDVR